MSASHLPDVCLSEASPPALMNDTNSCYCPDQASALEGSIEKPWSSDLADEEGQQTTSSWAKALFGKRSPSRDPDAIATRRSVFDDPHLAPFYLPKKDYENNHRFDPSARWTYREEKALLRKIDWKITVLAIVGYFALGLDNLNVIQANSADFLSDLHLSTNDFNLAITIYRVCYLCADLPSQLISKRIGPERWMPTQMCLWSIVTLCQFWLKGRSSFFACRALLGLAQGGFGPELVLYMSYFYTNTELPTRSAMCWMSVNLCYILGSLLAYGIFHLNGVAGKAGWRWLFLIEGLMTLAIGVAAFFNMPVSPTQTKTWFRPRGWLTEREEVIIVNKVLRDDPTKSDMHNREPVTLKRLWGALCDYDLWPVYMIGLVSPIPAQPPSNYLTLLLRHVGFSTFDTSLLTIPSHALGIVTVLIITLVSELIGERTFLSAVEDLWVLPFLVALYALPSKPNPWLLFGLLTGLLSYPSTAPIHLGWCSRNSGAVASRAVNASVYNMFVQASLAVSSQVYQAKDAPRYKRGNMILIILSCINILLLSPATKTYYLWRNKQRAEAWDAMTTEEKVNYLNTTKDVGNKRLDFRFAH